MAGERAADQRGGVGDAGGVSGGGLDAELDRAVGSVEPIAYVIVFVGNQPGRVYSLNRNTVLLGRVDDADIHIVDASVSARHAQIINGGSGFEIEDLDSTNGTFVGGQRVRRAPLRNGDRVTVGSVEFLFLVDRPVDSTIALLPPMRRPSSSSSLAMTATVMPHSSSHSSSYSHSQSMPQPMTSRVVRDRERDHDDEGPSLLEIVRRLVNAYRFVRKQAMLIFLMAAVGSLIGVASLFILPARSSAVSEVKLLPQVKSNPVDPQTRNQSEDDDSPQFFQGAERAFGQPDLVRATLGKIQANPDGTAQRTTQGKTPQKTPATTPARPPASPPVVTDADLRSISSRLKLEPLGEHRFRASYQDQRLRHEPWPLPAFLAVHLQNYVRSEIDKSLREFNAKVVFLGDQMKAVERDLASINEEKTRFREANPDSLPEDAAQTHTSRYQLQSHQTEILAQIRRLEGEVDSERQQLTAEAPLAQAKFQSAQTYRDSLADINRKLSDAYARGLADGHPDVVRLKAEKERIGDLITHEVQTTSSPLDRQSNANYQAQKSRVETLQAQLRAARTDLAETLRGLGQIRQVVDEQPRVEQRLVDLNRQQEVTTHLHAQLFEKLKQAELQLNLERVSAESRYEIIPPHLERPGTSLTIALRGAIGLMAGLLIAAAVIMAREGRKLVSQALATSEIRPYQSRP